MRTDHFLGWTPAGHKIWDGLDGLGFWVAASEVSGYGMGYPLGISEVPLILDLPIDLLKKWWFCHSLWWVYQRVTIQQFFFFFKDYHPLPGISTWSTCGITHVQLALLKCRVFLNNLNGCQWYIQLKWRDLFLITWRVHKPTWEHHPECSVLDSTAINCPLANSTRIASSSQILRQSWSVGIHQRWFQDSSKQ